MNDCLHMNTMTETAVYRLHNAADAERPFFSVALKVQCVDCQVFFRFLGRHPSAPDGPVDAIHRRLGAWTSDVGDELGVLISPMDTGGDLAMLAVQGRA
jgi:hypothetical protein